MLNNMCDTILDYIYNIYVSCNLLISDMYYKNTAVLKLWLMLTPHLQCLIILKPVTNSEN